MKCNMGENKIQVDKIDKLAHEIDLYLQSSDVREPEDALQKIKGILGKRGQGNIVLAQTNPIAGNVEYNALKVMKYINSAEKINADLIVFPELTLMGYPIQDTIDRHPVIVEQNVKWLKEIAKLTGKTRALIGFVEPREHKKVGKKYYNAAALVGDGKILAVVRKSLLPTYSEFNDYRYFEPSPAVGFQPAQTLCAFGKRNIQKGEKLSEIHGKTYGVAICEDGWNDKEFFKKGVLYDLDPVSKLAEELPDVIINCSASPTRTKKEQLKHNMLSFVSKKYKVPFVYVNQVGSMDDCSFDGSSRVYSADGKLIARAKSFEEQFFIVNLYSKNKIYPLAKGLEQTLKSQKVFSLNYEPDLERTYKTIIQGIRDYYRKNGLKRAVLGLSGGLDSSVSAVLLCDALGAKNVYGVSMPSKITGEQSRNDAKELAKNLGINFTEAPIVEMVNTANEQLDPLFEKIETDWNCKHSQSFVQDNIQARSRATLLWGISNAFGQTIPIATSDKSELYMGYATINGDMSGGFAPIADVPKTKLFALARWLNKNRKGAKNAIPEAVIAKPPGAELAINPKTGKPLTAEEALMPYEFLDEVIWRIENKHENYSDMLSSRFLYENKQQLSAEQKKKWLDKFYVRMSTALYKWSILPPSVIVEGRSINKSDYRQPITSVGIDYKGQSASTIAKKLKG